MDCSHDEARGKWCPFVRIATGSAIVLYNRDDRVCKCLGKGCMAWAWVSVESGQCGLIGGKR